MGAVRAAIVCLSRSGLETARRASEVLGTDVHGLESRVPGADVVFIDTIAHLQELFRAGTPVIGVCASGILIRAVAPLLGDKWSEPPVVAVSEDACTVVPLLGGHHGANRMARALGAGLGAHVAATTASDVAHGVALDDPPQGWVLANPEDAKAFAAGILAGEPVTVGGEYAQEADWLRDLPQAPEAKLRIVVTARAVEGDDRTLVYHPLCLALGVGCARNCASEELEHLVADTMREEGLAPAAVAGIYSVDLKADEAAMLSLAAGLDRPFRVFDAQTLDAETPRLANPSEVVFAEVGCHGVAEGAALAAGGPASELIVEKRKSANATCAIASFSPSHTASAGRKPGSVALIGIGPGQADWRTPEATRLIAAADDLVGYGLYIDLLGSLAAGKTRHDFALGEEEDRCRFALERAGEGRDVAVICSGDAGIYAMGALVYELLDRPEAAGGVGDAARRVSVVSAPGISALQAAAARAGAPLGHDFCAISLSDLLTPRETIVQRLKAAAEGDFVIAFYNPVSKRRRTLLDEAKRMLLAHRPPDTPVILASNLGRPAERVMHRTLADLETDEVDMLTVVLVGSSQSRRIARGEGARVYTPRGYAKRIDEPKIREPAE